MLKWTLLYLTPAISQVITSVLRSQLARCPWPGGRQVAHQPQNLRAKCSRLGPFAALSQGCGHADAGLNERKNCRADHPNRP